MGIGRIPAMMALGLIVMVAFAACSDLGSDDDASEENVRTVPAASSTDDGDESDDGDPSDDASTLSSSADEIDIGVVLSLSGPIGTYGSSSRSGIELAIDDFAGEDSPVALTFSARFLDDEGDAQTGAEQFRDHVDHDVMAILGPTLSNTAFEAHPVAQANGIPVLAISNTAAGITDTGDYIFRVSLAESAVVPQTVELISSAWQPQTAALVYSEDDAWSRSSADAFRDAAEAHDIQIVTEQDVPSDGEDLSEQVQAVADVNPDVIFISSLEGASIRFVTQARDYGLEQNMACGNGCNSGTFIDDAGGAAEGIVVGSAWHIDLDTEQSQAFVERYRAMHGTAPDQFSAQGYAGMQILAEAVSSAGEFDQRGLRDALAELGEVDTVLGPFTFDQNREGTHPAVITVVQGDDFAIFGK